jgi:phosphohistidine phosphatase
MKALTLLRHAKSSWKDPALTDFERPLNKRGKQNAPLMGQRLARRGTSPEMIIVSPAKRTRKTAELVAFELGYDEDAIRLDPEIYAAGLPTLMGVVSGLADAWQDVMLVGHNPGLTELANSLASRQIENIVTCGVVKLELGVASWRDVGPDCGRLLYYDFPKRNEPG